MTSNSKTCEPNSSSSGAVGQRTRFLKRSIYEHFKWPFKIVRGVGYVSFEHGHLYQSDEISYYESGCLSTKFPKSQVAYPLFCVLVALGCLTYYSLWGAKYFEKKITPYNSFESLVIVIAGFAVSTWTTFLKLYGLIYRRSAAAFMKSTISEVTSGISTLHVYSEDCRRILEESRRQTLNIIALYLTVILGYLFAINFVHGIVVRYFNNDDSGLLLNAAVSLLWNLVCYGHFGLSIWITSYLKLYFSCLRILNLELAIFEACAYSMTRLEGEERGEPECQTQQHSGKIDDAGNNSPKRRSLNSVQPMAIALAPISPEIKLTSAWPDSDIVTQRSDKQPETETPTLNPIAERFEPMLKNCILFYYKIEACVDNFNSFFSTILVIEFLYCIAVVTSSSFYFYAVIIERPIPVLVGMQGTVTLVLHALILYDYSTAASMMDTEVNNVLSRLQLISLQALSTEMRHMIQILVTKVSSCPPQASPGRYFTINRNLITSIVSALTAYLVILIQFRQGRQSKET